MLHMQLVPNILEKKLGVVSGLIYQYSVFILSKLLQQEKEAVLLLMTKNILNI